MGTETMANKKGNAHAAASWPYGLPGFDGGNLAATAGSGRTNLADAAPVGAHDREHLLDRLQHLRGILPVFAQELASSRRQAAALRVENRGLLEEVRRLRAQRQDTSRR